MVSRSNQRLLLGVTGGIAAYKAAELARLIVKAGGDVRVVLTESACRFVTPVTMQGLSGNPVYTDMWDPSVPNNMAHIELSRGCDAIVVAPASAPRSKSPDRTFFRRSRFKQTRYAIVNSHVLKRYSLENVSSDANALRKASWQMSSAS